MVKIILMLVLCICLSGCKLAYFNDELIEKYDQSQPSVYYFNNFSLNHCNFKDGILSAYVECDSKEFVDIQERLVIFQNGTLVPFSFNNSEFQYYYDCDFNSIYNNFKIDIEMNSFCKDEQIYFEFYFLNTDLKIDQAKLDVSFFNLNNVYVNDIWIADCDYQMNDLNQTDVEIEMLKQSDIKLDYILYENIDKEYLKQIATNHYLPMEYAIKPLLHSVNQLEYQTNLLIDYDRLKLLFENSEEDSNSGLYLSAFVDQKPVLINNQYYLEIKKLETNKGILEVEISLPKDLKKGIYPVWFYLSDGWGITSDISYIEYQGG